MFRIKVPKMARSQTKGRTKQVTSNSLKSTGTKVKGSIKGFKGTKQTAGRMAQNKKNSLTGKGTKVIGSTSGYKGTKSSKGRTPAVSKNVGKATGTTSIGAVKGFTQLNQMKGRSSQVTSPTTAAKGTKVIGSTKGGPKGKVTGDSMKSATTTSKSRAARVTSVQAGKKRSGARSPLDYAQTRKVGSTNPRPLQQGRSGFNRG